MNRRGFFATIAALCAAPAALFRAPKAKAASEGMTLGRGTLNTFDYERYHMPHVCHWKLRLVCSSEECTFCGDVRSRMRAIELDDFERHIQAHRDAMINENFEFVGYESASGTRAP